jgi:hypothetical protein
LEATHIQHCSSQSRGPSLQNISHLQPYSDFSLSDAALLWEPAAGEF